MTRVSKYYRKLGEPELYSAIHFHDGDHHRIKRLLITLLNRADLRPMIEIFTLSHKEADGPVQRPDENELLRLPQDIESQDLYTVFMSHAQDIQITITNIARRTKAPAASDEVAFACVRAVPAFRRRTGAHPLPLTATDSPRHHHVTNTPIDHDTRQYQGPRLLIQRARHRRSCIRQSADFPHAQRRASLSLRSTSHCRLTRARHQ
jgi:hypothetical protein